MNLTDKKEIDKAYKEKLTTGDIKEKYGEEGFLKSFSLECDSNHDYGENFGKRLIIKVPNNMKIPFVAFRLNESVEICAIKTLETQEEGYDGLLKIIMGWGRVNPRRYYGLCIEPTKKEIYLPKEKSSYKK